MSAPQLYRRRSQRRLKVQIYEKTVTLEAFVVVIFPQRSGKKMNIFFSTDVTMAPGRLLELYAARFKIEDLFNEIRTKRGFGDYRQRSFHALKRHAPRSVVAYT